MKIEHLKDELLVCTLRSLTMRLVKQYACKYSINPFVSVPGFAMPSLLMHFIASLVLRWELFLHSFNLHSISSSHTMRGRIIFEDLDTILHVSTFRLLDTMHMIRSPRTPTLSSVLPHCKCVKLEEYTGGQQSETHIPFVRLNRWSSLVHPLPG